MARIGTSGWTYPHWRQVLYRGVPAARWLERIRSAMAALGPRLEPLPPTWSATTNGSTRSSPPSPTGSGP